MNFGAGYLLWGTAAVGVPIALHFFFRSRYRLVPWAAMKFLLQSIEQTSRRLKFQELILLILRCTVIALLALALAQLKFTTAASGKDAVDAVFVFDTSFSMGAREGKQSRLDFAKSAALAVLDRLPASSTAQVVVCADRAELLGPREPGNLDQTRQIVNKIELTDLATDLAPGAAEAAAALQRGSAPNKELYVFSDMQRLGWEKNADPLAKTLKDLSAKATVYLVRCGTQTPRNVAVLGIAPQSGIPRPGERVGFAVVVRNTGIAPVENLRVALAVDGRAGDSEEQPIPILRPGETRAVTLTAKLGKAGLGVLTASVKADDLEADNHFSQVVHVRDQVRVLVIDGARDEREPDRSAAYFLEHALLPVKEEELAKHPIRLTSLTPRQAAATDLGRHDVCILVNVALERGGKVVEALPSDFVEALAPYVRKGGGLIVFGGDNVTPESYDRILGKRHGLLPLPVLGTFTAPDDNPLAVDRGTIDAPGLLPFREDEHYKGLGYVPVLKTLHLGEPVGDGKKGPKDAAAEKKGPSSADPVRVLMRYTDGKPALASRKVDNGEVLFFATSAGPAWKPGTKQPTWNWLYKWDAGYLPLTHALLNYLLHRQTQNHNFTAGDTLRWHPPPGQPGGDEVRYVLTHPPTTPKGQGKRVPLGRADTASGRAVVTATGLDRAGIYRLTTAGPEDDDAPAPGRRKALSVPFAVAPDLRESANLESLTDAQLDERLGFRPVHLTSDAAANVNTVTERTSSEWALWLLGAVLLLVVGETVLAWVCGRAW